MSQIEHPLKNISGTSSMLRNSDVGHMLELRERMSESDMEVIRLRAELAGILGRMPHTADGHPIFLGDTVFVENPDAGYHGEDEVISICVASISSDKPFAEYQGTFTIQGEESYEGGNLDCWKIYPHEPQPETEAKP